jgi:pyruvate-formate lyase-activating enzyme
MFALSSPIVLVFGVILTLWILIVLYGKLRNRLFHRGRAVQCFYCHQWTRLPPTLVLLSDEVDVTAAESKQHRGVEETPYDWFCRYCQNRNLRAKVSSLLLYI